MPHHLVAWMEQEDALMSFDLRLLHLHVEHSQPGFCFVHVDVKSSDVLIKLFNKSQMKKKKIMNHKVYLWLWKKRPSDT